MNMRSVTVMAYANIALLKYWGKRCEKLFLPTRPSLSLNLEALKTITTIAISSTDSITIRNNPDIKNASITTIQFLSLFRKTYGINHSFAISSYNTFPTSAGLSSSSSGFAALAYGLAALCSLNLSQKELSILARQGSGSACRSIPGGFAVWEKGSLDDGSDSYAHQLFNEQYWPELRMLIAITSTKSKKISSRDGMNITKETSRCYKTWAHLGEARLKTMIDALSKKDIAKLGQEMETDWQEFHDIMLSATPPLNYWNSTSYRIIEIIQRLRQRGIACYCTTDAGPHVKIICLKQSVPIIRQTIQEKENVSIIESEIAGAPIIVGDKQ